jgi:hypothetical protein
LRYLPDHHRAHFAAADLPGAGLRDVGGAVAVVEKARESLASACADFGAARFNSWTVDERSSALATELGGGPVGCAAGSAGRFQRRTAFFAEGAIGEILGLALGTRQRSLLAW